MARSNVNPGTGMAAAAPAARTEGELRWNWYLTRPNRPDLLLPLPPLRYQSPEPLGIYLPGGALYDFEMASLKFATLTSEIELPFYSALAALKIDYDRLDVSARHVLGMYGSPISISPDTCRMQILGNAFTANQVPAGFVRAEGIIKNVNTIEDFKNTDYAAMINTAGKQIWDAISDGTIYSVPSLLASFAILSFADLKKYKFTYWFAFPALHSAPLWLQDEAPGQFTGAESTALVERVGTWRMSVDGREHGFFLTKKVRKLVEDAGDRPSTPDTPGEDIGFKWEVGSLRDFERGFFKDVDPEDQYVAFVDPSTYAEHPGWMLRNLLILIRERYHLNKVQILCYRDVHSRRHEARSIILKLKSSEQVPWPVVEIPNRSLNSEMPKVTGWERNFQGKLTSRYTSLAQYMDPLRLADQSVDLNLKLMKWRVAPNLALDDIKQAKCLLLGAGTLGSYVSRILQGWNVRKITFVDNATVSFSNPVRQPLFVYKDCLDGGAKKAIRAAEALKEIYPGADSTGYAMSVPMLGHPITNEVAARQDFEKLKQLIDEHDAIFLLMDTRESRWLPTLMGKAAGKIVMNAALGFDTFVVMRHGMTPHDGGEAALGCYFCNDVVAPGDSIKDQTLDMQCTVTRPGIAAVASATLVEIFTSILQHPLGGLAPAPRQSAGSSSSSITYDRDPVDHPLGIVPHQIRGFLSSFQNMIISGKSYDCCSACSSKVVGAYRKDDWEFVKRALTERDYVTELSGLAEVQRMAEAAAGNVEWDSDEGGAEDDGEAVLL